MSVIKIQNLTRDYKNGHGIFDVSFEINQGEVFGFLGPNGAGKTTSIRHLMGFLHPQSGCCTINGRDCWSENPKIQKVLGYLPGEINLFDDMTGLNFLDFAAKYRGMKGEGRKRELLERFELDARGKFKKMSNGMKQKVGIVAAFMYDPEKMKLLDKWSDVMGPVMSAVGMSAGSTTLIFPGESDIPKLLLLNFGLLSLHLFIGSVCFLFSALANDTKYSIGCGAGIPSLMFILKMLSNVGESADVIKYFTFFSLFDQEKIITRDTFGIMGIAVLIAGAITLSAASIAVFDKKDLHI